MEFETEQETDREKAINVTAPGGGPIEPPIRKRRPRPPVGAGGNGGKGGGRGKGKGDDKPAAEEAAPAAEAST